MYCFYIHIPVGMYLSHTGQRMDIYNHTNLVSVTKVNINKSGPFKQLVNLLANT